jgi:dCTP deaminase
LEEDVTRQKRAPSGAHARVEFAPEVRAYKDTAPRAAKARKTLSRESRRIENALLAQGRAVSPSDGLPKRSQSPGKHTARSGAKTGPITGRITGLITGPITGPITGFASPVLADQAIDSAQDFSAPKKIVQNAGAGNDAGPACGRTSPVNEARKSPWVQCASARRRAPCTALFAEPRDASQGGSYKRAMSQTEDTLFGDTADAGESYGRHSTGILPSHVLRRLIRARREVLAAEEIEDSQIQPASLDLRVGAMAWRVRASFLPGPHATVRDKLATVALHEIDLTQGAVLETGCVYVVPLLESVEFSARVSGIANPKSSTGRLDVFTRLITDRAQGFDRIEPGYRGPLYAEISPRTFPVLVRKGSRLNQLRVRSGSPQFTDTQLKRLNAEQPLVDGPADIDNGLALSVDLRGDSLSKQVGWRAKRHTGIIDIDLRAALDPLEYWEPIYASRSETIVLDPDEFYILASREAVAIPPDFAAEMVPFNPLVGEFRVHYAGFFDPGFGHEQGRGRGARAVLEVRSREVPFIIEHGQIIGRLVFERLTDPPPEVYGQGIGSNYQRQGLKLSKHFRQP